MRLHRLSLAALAGVAGIVIAPVVAHADVITQWDFNSSLTTPSTGAGTISLLSGVTSSSVSGAGSTDVATTNNALNTTTYPAQGAGSQTAGVQFAVSTASYTNPVFTFDIRFSNTASANYAIRYSTDGTNFQNFTDITKITAGTSTTGTATVTSGGLLNFSQTGTNFFNGNSIDFSGIPAASNNANFKVQVVSSFSQGGSSYTAAGSTSTYGTAGTVRFDMATLNGTFQPVPAPPAAVSLGIGGLVGLMGTGVKTMRARKQVKRKEVAK